MSSAKTGHAAQDADTETRSLLADLPDDEARGRFIVAAVAHAESQLEILTGQAEAVSAKAEEVRIIWQRKADEAQEIAEDAATELTRWKHELDERTGF